MLTRASAIGAVCFLVGCLHYQQRRTSVATCRDRLPIFWEESEVPWDFTRLMPIEIDRTEGPKVARDLRNRACDLADNPDGVLVVGQDLTGVSVGRRRRINVERGTQAFAIRRVGSQLAPAAMPAPVASGPSISRDQIVAVVDSQLTAIEACKQEALDRNDLPPGHYMLTASWMIRSDGRVAELVVAPETIRGSLLESCAARVLRSWTFPNSGGEIPVRNYPLASFEVPFRPKADSEH